MHSARFIHLPFSYRYQFSMLQKANPSISSALKTCVLLFLFLILLFAAYLSFRWALADILSVQARHQLGKAQTVDQTFNHEQWRLTEDLLATTLELHPDYSGYLEIAEMFYLVASDQPPELLDELGWSDSRQQALDSARRMALIRPSWPYFWNELVRNKVALDQYDNELAGAMERAVTLGPWEEPVQSEIAFTGLDHWQQLPNEARPWVLQALDKILDLRNDPKDLILEIQAHPNFDKLCLSVKLKTPPRYCQQPSKN